MKKKLRTNYVLPAIIAFAFSLMVGTANAQNWTLSSTHIYNNNVGNVGIGMTAPQSTLHMGDGNTVSALLGLNAANFVLSKDGGTTGMQGIVASSGAAGHRMNFEGIRARGTLASPQVPQLDDRVFTLTGKIFDGSGVQNTAQVAFFVDGTVSTGVAPQRISFRTGPTNTASKTENLVIESTGEVVILNAAAIGGNFAPGGLLGLADGNTYLDVDGSNNLTFTDAVTGTKTLAELATVPAETDPVFGASPAAGITGAQITNWDRAFGWGDHSAAGYLTSFTEIDPEVGTNTTNYVPKWDGSALVTGTIFDNGKVGIGTTSPLANLQVGGIDGLLVTGTFGSGTISASGAGTRMIWYPGKAAFRSGYVDGTQWDDVNIGDYSTAVGNSTTASGWGSMAMGYDTDANNTLSTAMGYHTTAPSYAETVVGMYEATYTAASSTAWNSTDRLFVVGNGTAGAARSNAVTVLKNGYVGIGTVSPSEKTEVQGNVLIRNPTNNGALILSPSNNGYGVDGELVIQSTEAGDGSDAAFHISRNAIYSGGTFQYIDDVGDQTSKIEFHPGGDITFSAADAGTGPITFNENVRITLPGNVALGGDDQQWRW